MSAKLNVLNPVRSDTDATFKLPCKLCLTVLISAVKIKCIIDIII